MCRWKCIIEKQICNNLADLYRHRGLNMRVMLVIMQTKIVELITEYVFDCRVNHHLGQLKRGAGQLKFGLF